MGVTPLVFQLPPHWVQLLSRDSGVHSDAIERFVQHSVAGSAQRSVLAGLLRAQLQRAAVEAKKSGAGAVYIGIEPEIGAPILLLTFEPFAQRFSPAVGTGPEGVIAEVSRQLERTDAEAHATRLMRHGAQFSTLRTHEVTANGTNEIGGERMHVNYWVAGLRSKYVSLAHFNAPVQTPVDTLLSLTERILAAASCKSL